MPLRTCVGCREVKDKGFLVRVAALEGVLKCDAAGTLPGRGAYICRDERCLDAAYKNKGAFARALKANAALPLKQGLWQEIIKAGHKK